MPAEQPHAQIPDIVDRPVLRASGPPEIVQLVPYLIGFHPHESLVMMAMRGRRIVVSVRYDLGAPVEVASSWFRSAAKAGADHVVVVVYREGITGHPLPLREYVDQLRELFGHYSLVEVDAIAVSDGRWWSYRCEVPTCCPPEGTPIDPTGPIAASAVSEGMVALPGREALESELEIDQLAMAIVDAEITKVLVDSWVDLVQLGIDLPPAADEAWNSDPASGYVNENDSLPDLTPEELATLETWRRARRANDWKEVRAFVKKARKGHTITPAESARVLAALSDRSVRDAAIGYLVGPPDRGVREAWRQLTRVAPQPWRAAPATLYAIWCYASGSGARSNVAVDVALAADPSYAMAQIMLDLLMSGLNPFEFINDLATEAQRVGRRIQRRRDPLGRRVIPPDTTKASASQVEDT